MWACFVLVKTYRLKGRIVMAEDNGEKNEQVDENEDKAIDESIYGVKGAAKKARRAMKDTAQQYLDIAGMKLDLEDVEERIRDSPYYSVAIAAGVGFLLGGGLATTPGIALLGLFGRRAVRDTASNFGRQVFRGTR
jgi:ElaB/YqjD/DUF883 family membrane-anchored ribosome-binding protein